ncbi:HEAT repeat domain-containing protein [Candidatus Uabimicrobium sp. HlEnr_7]|uniref:HEAT repeat domain-containing protein n=1 Tax=Candidatus Uabimicrobium helgolandensis TaxID=3095367 RepID=UPI003558B437
MTNEDNIIKFVDLFSDDEVDVRYNAVIELTKIGRPAIPYLLAALDHKNWLVRYNSVRTISFMNDRSKVVMDKLSLQLEKEHDHDVLVFVGQTIDNFLMVEISLISRIEKLFSFLTGELLSLTEKPRPLFEEEEFCPEPFYISSTFSEGDALTELLALKTCKEILDERALKDKRLSWLWDIKKKIVRFCIARLETLVGNVEERKKYVSPRFREEIVQTHPLLQGINSLENFSFVSSRKWASSYTKLNSNVF